jgi:hypothetical protein
MLNTSPAEINSFNGMPGIDNRKARVQELLKLKEKAEQMAQAGADPASVKSMIQEERKALAFKFPDETSYKKAVNASSMFKGMSEDAAGNAPPPQSPEAQAGGFNPGFGMSANTGAPTAPGRSAAPPPQAQEIDRLYQQAGFRGGPAPRLSNEPGEIISMLPHDIG